MMQRFGSGVARFSPRSTSVMAAGLALVAAAGLAHAGDVTWDNGSSDMLWNSSSLNWSGAAWNNAAGDGAVFMGSGMGPISVPGPIAVRSMNFTSMGYSFSGPGPLSFTTTGTSTLGAGVVSTDAGVGATINTPFNSAVGLQKAGDGVLELGPGNSFSGNITAFNGGGLPANVQVGVE